MSELFGISEATVYRDLRGTRKPKPLHRSDRGKVRVIPQMEMERYCQIIAALKLRTRNKKGRHLSTNESIRLLEDFGIETDQGLVKAPKKILKKTTVNRHLRKMGLDGRSFNIEPTVTRFQARHANDCWNFDLSPSDLKTLSHWPEWVREKR